MFCGKIEVMDKTAEKPRSIRILHRILLITVILYSTIFSLSTNQVSATIPCTTEHLSVADYNLNSDFSIKNIDSLTIPTGGFHFNIPTKYEKSAMSISINNTTFYQRPVSNLLSPYESYNYYISKEEFNQNFLQGGKNLQSFNNSRLKFNLGNTPVGDILLQYKPAFCPPVRQKNYSLIVLPVLSVVALIGLAISVVYLSRKKAAGKSR